MKEFNIHRSDQFVRRMLQKSSLFYIVFKAQVLLVFLGSWVGMLSAPVRRIYRSQDCPDCGACRDVERVLLNVHHTIPSEKNFLIVIKVLITNAFEAFNHGTVFDEVVLYLGEKQGVLVNENVLHGIYI